MIVANAGITIPEAWHDITPESFRDVIDINVTGVWNTVQAGAQHIIDGGNGGSIILVSSLAGVKMQASWCTTPPASTLSPGWRVRSPPSSAGIASG